MKWRKTANGTMLAATKRGDRMNRQPPDTPEAFTPEPPVCHIDDRMYTRLQWLVYSGVGVLVVGAGLAIYKALRFWYNLTVTQL